MEMVIQNTYMLHDVQLLNARWCWFARPSNQFRSSNKSIEKQFFPIWYMLMLYTKT